MHVETMQGVGIAMHNTVLQTNSPRTPVELADPDGRVRTDVRLRFSHNIVGFELHDGLADGSRGGYTNLAADLPTDVCTIVEFDYNFYQHLGTGSAWDASATDGHPIPKVVRSSQHGGRYGLNLSEWQQQSSLDAHSSDGDIPGVTVPDGDLWRDPRDWSDPAFMAHFTPDPTWARCAGADTPGAVDCAGNRLGVMEPFEAFAENDGLGWAGPPIIRERYPLPHVATASPSTAPTLSSSTDLTPAPTLAPSAAETTTTSAPATLEPTTSEPTTSEPTTSAPTTAQGMCSSPCEAEFVNSCHPFKLGQGNTAQQAYDSCRNEIDTEQAPITNHCEALCMSTPAMLATAGGAAPPTPPTAAPPTLPPTCGLTTCTGASIGRCWCSEEEGFTTYSFYYTPAAGGDERQYCFTVYEPASAGPAAQLPVLMRMDRGNRNANAGQMVSRSSLIMAAERHGVAVVRLAQEDGSWNFDNNDATTATARVARHAVLAGRVQAPCEPVRMLR